MNTQDLVKLCGLMSAVAISDNDARPAMIQEWVNRILKAVDCNEVDFTKEQFDCANALKQAAATSQYTMWAAFGRYRGKKLFLPDYMACTRSELASKIFDEGKRQGYNSIDSEAHLKMLGWELQEVILLPKD